jgi:hypothetical protein
VKILVRITRETVIEGIKMREQVKAPELGLGEDAFIVIRPLSAEEMSKVTKTVLGDMTKKDVDNKKLFEVYSNEQKSKFEALSLAMSIDGETYTPAEVSGLPHAVVERAYSVLSEISGFMSPQQKLMKKRLELVEKKVLQKTVPEPKS